MLKSSLIIFMVFLYAIAVKVAHSTTATANAVNYDVSVSSTTSLSNRQRNMAINGLDREITRAVNGSVGFYEVEYISLSGLTFHYQVTFLATVEGNFFRFPFSETIASLISDRFHDFDYQLPNTNISFEESIVISYGQNQTGLCLSGTTPNFCSTLYGLESTCVDVGGSSAACVCLNSNDEIFCQNLPPQPITANSLRYLVTVTFSIASPSQQQIADLYQAQRTQLLFTALRSLQGYRSVRFSNYSLGSLHLTSLIEFQPNAVNDVINYPTPSSINRRLTSRARDLNDTLLSLPSGLTSTFSRDFQIVKQDINGLCNTTSRCPSPPSGYTSLCLEIGSFSTECFCVSSTDTAFNCTDVTPVNPPPDGGVGIGVIVGAVVGGLVLIVIVIVLVICWRRKRDRKPPLRTSVGADSSYIDAKDIDTVPRKNSNDNIYMEITPNQYGQYLEIDEMNDKANKCTRKSDDNRCGDEQEDSNDDFKPKLPGNHPTIKISKLEENDDGYLVPTPEMSVRRKTLEPRDSVSTNSNQSNNDENLSDVGDHQKDQKKNETQQPYVMNNDVIGNDQEKEKIKSKSDENEKDIPTYKDESTAVELNRLASDQKNDENHEIKSTDAETKGLNEEDTVSLQEEVNSETNDTKKDAVKAIEELPTRD